MKFDPAKHYKHSNGCTLRCRKCNKYIDRCVCDPAVEAQIKIAENRAAISLVPPHIPFKPLP
jgi:hypothetical protein